MLYSGQWSTVGHFMSKTICLSREHLRGKYHCTVDLLFDWFRNVPLCWVH